MDPIIKIMLGKTEEYIIGKHVQHVTVPHAGVYIFNECYTHGKNNFHVIVKRVDTHSIYACLECIRDRLGRMDELETALQTIFEVIK